MKKNDAGFSVIETVVVAAVSLVSIGLAAPSITTAIDAYKFNSDVQSVGAVIRATRYKSVASNVAMRLRFNCPSTGEMRVVQVTGNAAIDDATNRCDLGAYPFPTAVGSVTPNDGPVLPMARGVQFPANVSSIQVDTAGRMVPLTGCPACAVGAPPFIVWMTDTKTNSRRSMTVTTGGAVTVSPMAVARVVEQQY
jgi:type II secretory pathway pseudopilin PulG